MDTRKVVIFDLDGTLALIGHRRHLVEQNPPDWPSFYRSCVNDDPNDPIIELFLTLVDSGQYRVFIFSGRSDEVRGYTEDWLTKHGIVDYEALYMRPEGDYSSDVELKERMLRMAPFSPDDITFVADDRDKVVRFWRGNGITCLQVADGDF